MARRQAILAQVHRATFTLLHTMAVLRDQRTIR
jgi:hypothetical protein